MGVWTKEPLAPADALSEQGHTGAAPFVNPRSPAPLLARFCKGTVASSSSERTTPGTTPVRVRTFVLPSSNSCVETTSISFLGDDPPRRCCPVLDDAPVHGIRSPTASPTHVR